MKTYILVDENFEAVASGTDSLIMLDGRLNNFNKRQKVLNYIDTFKKNLPYKFDTLSKAKFAALFNSSMYCNGKYIYKRGLIKL